MDRRSRFAFILATASLLTLGTLSRAAYAAPKDSAAQKIDQNAMNNDFLMADFPKAATHLKKAVSTCGASGCSPSVKAKILVHLGIVLVNNGKNDEAEKAFVEALGLDKSIEPEKDFTTPDIAKVFEAAKKKAPTASATTNGSSGSEADGSEAETVGEISHMSVPEQMINTPVPIWVQTPNDLPVGRVLLRYKPFGGVWKKLNLRKKRGGWGGEIPCTDVTTTGELKYYINILDKSGDPLTALGSLSKPYVIVIKNQLDGDPPHLPHEPPPARCQAKEDCPPGLPGCPTSAAGKSGRGDKGWGATCEDTSECRPGFSCQDGVCEEGGDEGFGEEDKGPSSPYAKNWVGIFAGMDFAWVSGTNVCGKENQYDQGNFSCFIRSGDDAGEHYWGNPIPQGASNAIAGGFAPATQRLLLSYERALTPNITVGARLGYAFSEGPEPASSTVPFHAELRGSYWLGKEPLSHKGLRPFISASLGMGEVDAMVVVKVTEQPGCQSPYDGLNTTEEDGMCHVSDNGGQVDQSLPTEEQQDLNVWRKAGQGFAGVGGGAMYAFDAKQGIVGELRMSFMFPTTNLVVTPMIGYVRGF